MIGVVLCSSAAAYFRPNPRASASLSIMRILELAEIQRVLAYGEIVGRMREALIAWSRGECDMPMPMHLGIAAVNAEVHIKASYRRGGKYFALKMAGTFPGNLARGLPVGNGMMLLSSADTGEPVAFLADAGHLTDVRTAAVAALVARELGRRAGVPSYRRGGKSFALKMAGTFPGNLARGLPVGNGMMLLSSADTGEPVAFLADE